MAKQSILEVLKTANLDEMREELTGLEKKLEEATSQIREDIDALKLAIKFVDAAQNGKPKKTTVRKSSEPTVTRTQRASPGGGPTIADRAVTYLEAAGEATPAAIAKGLELINPTSIYSTLSNDNRFLKTEKGTYRLRGY